MTTLEQDLVRQLSEVSVSVELETEDMTLNIGPQHPSTHGVLRLVAKVDGERAYDVRPVVGYMHRGYEKLAEVRTYPQVTALVNRIDWVSGYANEIPFIVAAEKLMEIEVPERAQYIRLILTEMARISSHLMFMGSYPLELGAATPLMFGLRERERVLDLIEGVTGGRFHPNFNRIGGVKPAAGAGSTQRKTVQDLPKGFLQDTRNAMDRVFEVLKEKWGKIDYLVHAIGFSDKNELRGRYVDTSAENFAMTMNISCFSFTALAQRAEKLMDEGGSMLTLSYLGAERVVPHYNVMGVAKSALETSVKYLAKDLGVDGIRVNAISAGPIKTLAASGIGDFRYILKWNEYNSALRRNITIEDVGGAALYLLSDLSAGVTGETHHVDAGYHIQGMKMEDAPDISVENGDK